MASRDKLNFIVFEGIDGSGKTTISKMLLSHLKERGEDVVWMREPSDSVWGQKIRELAEHKDAIPIEDELNYFINDRKLNVKENILPALESGKRVILDRYFFSTACYQGARGLDMDEILKINRSFAPEPDITFLIDVDVDTALSRISRGRKTTVKLFEKKEFLQKVRENYLNLQEKNIVVVDGTPSEKVVFQLVLPFIY